MLTCPVCRSNTIRRSVRRTFVEKLWSLGGRYPFRCYDCQTRFFAYHLPDDDRHEDREPDERRDAPREKRKRSYSEDED